MNGSDITTSTERAVTSAANDDGGDGRIVQGVGEARAKGVNSRCVQRVQRRRTIDGDTQRIGALCGKYNVIHYARECARADGRALNCEGASVKS